MQAKMTGYMVGAMDDTMLRALSGAKISTWRMNTGIHEGDLGWGSPNFHAMGRFKIALINQVCVHGCSCMRVCMCVVHSCMCKHICVGVRVPAFSLPA